MPGGRDEEGARRSKGPRARVAAACAVAAFAVAFLPEHAGLGEPGRRALFVAALAAGLWIFEAIPPFATGLLVIALEIALLGRPGGGFAESPEDWERFVRPWASPVIWLFFGGLVMAEGASTTGLDRLLASRVLRLCGGARPRLLFAVMAVTFAFSMFVSNTATTAMMLAAIAPILGRLPERDPFAKALLLGVPVAASLGGMGSILGTPPNAIAAGALAGSGSPGFARWMALGLPPAAVIAALAFAFLLARYRGPPSRVLLPEAWGGAGADAGGWRRATVFVVFVATVLLWMTPALHGVPAPVVSFLPITVFAATGVLDAADVRRLRWDVLLLLAGGLALGVGVQDTGLAAWLVGRLPIDALGPLGAGVLLACVACGLSNFMSNTAAANLLVPIAAAVPAASPEALVVPVALGASLAMCLPVSTPPNALAYASGRLKARDFLLPGLLCGLLGAPLAALWCS